MKVFLLQFFNELWKLFAKKRTYIGLAMFLIAQNAVILLFRFTRATGAMQRTLEGNGYSVTEYMSALTLSTMMVIVMAYTLLPLYVTLMGGDFVAKEVEDGTLRMILSRPISRLRLILLKWLAGGVFSAVMVFALGGFGWVFSALWFPPTGGLFVIVCLAARRGVFRLWVLGRGGPLCRRARGDVGQSPNDADAGPDVLLFQHEARRGHGASAFAGAHHADFDGDSLFS
jgi:ABC-2 type transport system permease protein